MAELGHFAHLWRPAAIAGPVCISQSGMTSPTIMIVLRRPHDVWQASARTSLLQPVFQSHCSWQECGRGLDATLKASADQSCHKLTASTTVPGMAGTGAAAALEARPAARHGCSLWGHFTSLPERRRKIWLPAHARRACCAVPRWCLLMPRHIVVDVQAHSFYSIHVLCRAMDGGVQAAARPSVFQALPVGEPVT